MARTNLGKIVMIPKGTYSTTVTYSKLDVVTSNGSGYISKSDNNLNKPLTNETYWMKLVEKGDKGDKGDSYTITEADIQEIEDYVVSKTSGQIIATRNELERVKNDVLETGTDTDTYIHLEDSAMAEYQELSVDGVCEQKTTKGKNLLNVPNDFSITGTPSKSINLSAGTYYLTCQNVTEGGENNPVIVINGGAGFIGLTNNMNWKFTTTSDITSVQFYSNGYNYNNSQGITSKVEKLMISTSGGEYEPYTGGQPSPSPVYPQPISTIENSLKITSCNKNLFDKDNVVIDKLVNRDTGEIYTTTAGTYASSDFIKVEENTQYTTTNCLMYYNALYDKYKNYIGHLPSNNATFTTPINVKYMRVSVQIANLNNVQFEKGTQTTPFEQHLETQITANLPEGEFIGKIDNTYKDTLKVEYNEEDGQYHLNLYKNIGKVVLDGSESWMMKNNTDTNIHFSSNVLDNLTNGLSQGISNYFSNVVLIWDNDIQGIELVKNNYHLRIRLLNTLLNEKTINGFIQFLSTNKPIVYYPLATPYVVDLGVVDMPITYNEQTNLFTDSNLMPNINAKYYRNFITTIQNLQVNEKALKQELVDINTRLSALESASTNVVSESEVIE